MTRMPRTCPRPPSSAGRSETAAGPARHCRRRRSRSSARSGKRGERRMTPTDRRFACCRGCGASVRRTSGGSRMPGTVPASGCITPFRRRPAGRNFFRPLPRGAFRRQGCGAWPSAPPSGCVRKTARGNPRMRGCSPSTGEEERCCMNCPEAAPSRSSQSLPMCGSCRGRPCAISSSAPVRTTSIRSFIQSAAAGRAPEAAARTGGGGRRFVNLLIISKSVQDSALIS